MNTHEKLHTALRPFAALLQPHHAGLPDDRPVFGVDDTLITVGDLRRACRAVGRPIPGEAPVTPPPAHVSVATPPAKAAPSSPKGRAAARTALAATLGMDSRELSEYAYQPGKFDRAIYCAGGFFWAVGPVPPKADVGEPWEKHTDQFWADRAGTTVWRSKEVAITRTQLKKGGA